MAVVGRLGPPALINVASSTGACIGIPLVPHGGSVKPDERNVDFVKLPREHQRVAAC